jgi:CMP-N-acetylneuraminic acid synthetase
LTTLSCCPRVGQIVVDTDSPVIRRGVAEAFPEVTLIDRPEDLRAEDVPMNEVLVHDIKGLPGRFFLQTHSTNPLLRSETIERGIEAFFDAYPDHDSLFGVTRLQTRLYDREGHPLNHNPEELLRTQDLPPVYEENSCLYIFEREGFLTRRNRIGPRAVMFEVGRGEAWDIDEELDFRIVEALMAGER